MTSTAVQKLMLVLSICLIVIGLGFTIAGAFSPAWQVVDIREFRAEHQHGLWWDCVRAEKHVVAVGDFYDETPLHCMYKFDESAAMVIDNSLLGVDDDGAAGESEHHRFWAWHKAILFFIIFSQIMAFVSICTGVCAPCFHPTTFIFTISLFVALICSVIADGVFFLAANRVDNRFVQGMVGTYEQRIGYAFYLHLGGTICWSIAFTCALATTYKFFTSNGSRINSLSSPERRTPYNHLSAPNNNALPAAKPLLKTPKSLLKGGVTAYNNSPRHPNQIRQTTMVGDSYSNAPTPPPRIYRETSA